MRGRTNRTHQKACSNTRSTLARQTSAACVCLTCCCLATTLRSRRGVASRHSTAPASDAQTCSRPNTRPSWATEGLGLPDGEAALRDGRGLRWTIDVDHHYALACRTTVPTRAATVGRVGQLATVR